MLEPVFRKTRLAENLCVTEESKYISQGIALRAIYGELLITVNKVTERTAATLRITKCTVVTHVKGNMHYNKTKVKILCRVINACTLGKKEVSKNTEKLNKFYQGILGLLSVQRTSNSQ